MNVLVLECGERRTNLTGERVTQKLTESNPEVVKYWHPTKNKHLLPENFTRTSRTVIWWLCPKASDHEWSTRVFVQVKSTTKCPFCSSNRVSSTNSLAACWPDVAKQWHPTLNGELTPNKVAGQSNKKVWWFCSVCDNSFESRIQDRTHRKTSGCPYCVNKAISIKNCLATTHPAIARCWHPTKNGDLTPFDVVGGAGLKVWWQCDKGHEWVATLNKRTCGRTCPRCKESVGELAIANALSDLGLDFKREHKFPECRDKYPLPFDFSVIIGKQLCIIEFNGQQHYRPSPWFTSHDSPEDAFKRRKVIDKKKRAFCHKMGFPMLIIPYWKMKHIKHIVSCFVDSMMEYFG